MVGVLSNKSIALVASSICWITASYLLVCVRRCSNTAFDMMAGLQGDLKWWSKPSEKSLLCNLQCDSIRVCSISVACGSSFAHSYFANLILIRVSWQLQASRTGRAFAVSYLSQKFEHSGVCFPLLVFCLLTSGESCR